MAELKLKILMQAVDRVTAPMRGIRATTTRLQSSIGQTADKLRGLERTSQQMQRFRALKTEAAGNATALQAAQQRAQALAQAMAGTDKVTRAMRREFAAATGDVTRLKEAQTRGAAELQQLRSRLRGAGIDTTRLASEQRRLKAEIAGTTAAADRQARALERVQARNRAMAAAKGKMEKTQAVAGSMAGAGAAGLATGGGALAGVAGAAMIGIDFEAMMSKVGALAKVDKTSEAFAKLEKQAFDLGATTSFSASQAAEAMSNLAMAGFDAEKILGVMPSMLNLAKAGTTDLGATASITGNIMAGFGLQASQMGDVGDVLVATFTNSNTNLEMLGETMKYVAPIAKAAGYSLGDMATLAGLLGNVGIQGSEAGTAMRASLIRLAAPPTEAQKALTALGVSTKDVAGNLRPMSSVLGDIAQKTKAMGNAQKIEIFSKVFGVEAAAAMTELVGQAGAQGIADFAETIKKAHGLNDRISAQMADNAKGDLDNLSSAMEGVAIILTKLNIQPLRDLTQWAAAAVTSAGDWMQANQALTATLAKIAVVIAGVIFAGGALALVIAGILGPFAMLRFTLTALGISIGPAVAAFGALGRAILSSVVPALWTMTTALLANPLTWVVAAIAAAAAVLIIGWEPVAAFFAGVWDGVTAAFSAAWAAIKGTLGFDPLTVLAAVWQPVGAFLSGLWTGLAAPLASTWETIKAILAWTPLGLIVANWQPISDFLSSLWDGIAAKISAVWSGITDKLSGIKEAAGWISDKWNGLFGDGTAIPKLPAAPAGIPAGAGGPAPIPVPTVQTVPVPQPANANQSPPANGNSPATVHQTVTITINAAPGQSTAEIAREVARQLDQRAARAQSAARSALYDSP
ncbi:phage tail tape measure protein [Azospirillum argentinense]